jgi:hypothetical protein
MIEAVLLGYVDPGSGLLIWQMIGAAFVGLIFYFKKTRQFVGTLFRKVFRRDP